MKKVSHLIRILSAFFAFICLFYVSVNFYMCLSTRKYIYTDLSLVPEKYTVIVPGAGVISKEIVSYIFRDRLYSAMELYKNQTVQKILVSGDHGTKYYDEVHAAKHYYDVMFKYDQQDLFLDHAGFDTYSTMYRAANVFEVNDAVICSQKFHLYRSIYIARKLGIDACGYVCPEKDHIRKIAKIKWNIRESFARVKAFLNIMFIRKPKYLGTHIPITGDGSVTF